MTADVSHIFENARVAARKLNLVDTETIDKILLAVADEAEKEVDYILQENCRDLALMPKTDPKYDRLMLSRGNIRNPSCSQRPTIVSERNFWIIRWLSKPSTPLKRLWLT